jgi:S-adenosylmethionine hydrolase
VLFLSDFGERDGAVAACKGVMLGIEPRLRIVDLTHDVPPYDVETAADVLEQAIPFYQPGTVAVAVVDPGVGSERKPLAILTRRGHLLVGPDNGIFTLVVDAEGLERADVISSRRWPRTWPRASRSTRSVPRSCRCDWTFARPGSSRARSKGSCGTWRTPTATS